MQKRTQSVGNLPAKTGESWFKKTPPHVLRFVRKWRVSDKEIPRKMLECPAVGFHQLVLCERDGFKVTRFGRAIAAVCQSDAERSLAVQRMRSVADEGSNGVVCVPHQVRSRNYFPRRSCKKKKKIAAIGLKVK